MWRRNLVLTVCVLVAIAVSLPALARSSQLLVRIANGQVDWQRAAVIVDSKRLTSMAELLRELSRHAAWEGQLPTASGAMPVDGWAGGETGELKVPAIAIGGKIWLPLGQLARDAGLNCRWDPATGMLELDRAAPPAADTSLSYSLVRSENEVLLVVTNRGTAARRLTFATSQRFDFAAVNAAGREVWRWSNGQAFAQVAAEDRIGPGDSRVYQATLPGLSPGSYRLRAYFPPAGRTPVAEIAVDIAGSPQALGLTYELKHRPATAVPGNDYPRMTFQVLNHTPSAMTLHHRGDSSYRLVVFDRHGRVAWEYRGQRWSTADSEQMAAGSARFFSVRMPSLARGSYRAEAYFFPAGDRPVATITFAVN